MIEKIRRTLSIKYTVIIACILFLGFAASYAAYLHNGIRLLEDSLYDYLSEEVWEAEEFFRGGTVKKEVHAINSDIKSLYNFTYWVVGKEVIRAEIPANQGIAGKLEQRLLNKTYKSGKIYHENIKYDKQKWYFVVVRRDISSETVKNGEVFAIANYTPMRTNAKTYVKVAAIAAVLMMLLSYFIGNFFAARSMEYIEKSYEKQKRFVSDAAHELRTPLAVLNSYAELLEYHPRKKAVIADIKEEITLMSNMVDRLLAIARYDNSKIVMKKERFAINQVISDAVKAMENLCAAGTFRLAGVDEDIIIEADKVMIRQLLGILLDNAVKYTGKDKKITVNLSRRGSRLQISVKDNGIGIKTEDLPHIFDRFWRAEKSRSQKGLGLGLSLAAAIVKLHKGTIDVQSEEGKGTVFDVVLPLK